MYFLYRLLMKSGKALINRIMLKVRLYSLDVFRVAIKVGFRRSVHLLCSIVYCIVIYKLKKILMIGKRNNLFTQRLYFSCLVQFSKTRLIPIRFKSILVSDMDLIGHVVFFYLLDDIGSEFFLKLRFYMIEEPNSEKNVFLNEIYHMLDPVAFTIGPLSVRWYALAYLAGFVCAGIVMWRTQRRWGLGLTSGRSECRGSGLAGREGRGGGGGEEPDVRPAPPNTGTRTLK